eukprot:1408111-Prymnesium_polylepis.1
MQRFGAATSHASRLLSLPPPPDATAAAAAGKEARALVVDIQRRVAEVRSLTATSRARVLSGLPPRLPRKHGPSRPAPPPPPPLSLPLSL